jgi:type III secretion protein R
VIAALAPAAAGGVASDDLLGRPLALVVALALVSLLPFVFMSVTSFVKISTVLQIVRSAIGAQSVPSNTVVMALSAALTVLAMAPVGQKIADRASPLLRAKETPDTIVLVRQGIDAVREPMREFLSHNASTREKARFLAVARQARPEAERKDLAETDLPVLVPSFVVTELTEAFGIGFLIFLPFLVIDLVIANVLLALGMQMLSPTQVSLPFKLLLFVAIDGWGLLAQALVAGYR